MVSTRAKEALVSLEDDLGGRAVLVETLHFANLDPRGVEFVRQAGSLGMQAVPLATLCRQCNISPYEIIKLHREGALNRGQTIAYTRAAEAMNAIMDDLIDKAVDHEVDCPRCDGTGELKNKAVCPDCTHGKRFIGADPKAQTKLLDIMQLGRKAGLNVGIVNKFDGSGGGFFDEFVKASDKATRNLQTEPAVDGQVVS